MGRHRSTERGTQPAILDRQEQGDDRRPDSHRAGGLSWRETRQRAQAAADRAARRDR